MDFQEGDLITYYDQFAGKSRYGVIKRIDQRAGGFQQLWCQWGDSEAEARNPKPDTPLTWLDNKIAQLVASKKELDAPPLIRGGAYCSPCGGFGGHRLMCPTMRKG